MIKIDEDLCKGCHLCVFICYRNVYAISSTINKKGVALPYSKYEKKCTSCGDCELICPDQAIDVGIEKHWWIKKENNWKFNPNFSKIKQGD